MLKTMISVGANKSLIYNLKRMLDSSVAKESACNAGDLGLIPRLGRSLGWRREWLPTPVFLPGEAHGLRSLVGYSP